MIADNNVGDFMLGFMSNQKKIVRIREEEIPSVSKHFGHESLLLIGLSWVFFTLTLIGVKLIMTEMRVLEVFGVILLMLCGIITVFFWIESWIKWFYQIKVNRSLFTFVVFGVVFITSVLFIIIFLGEIG